MATPWAPPLPTIGRAGPRILVSACDDTTLLAKLEKYFCTYRSVCDVFERRISPAFQEKCLRYRMAPRYLSEMSPSEQQSVLLRNLYFRASSALRSKMRRRLDAGHLNQVRSWFHTANAAVLPFLIGLQEPEDVSHTYGTIDALTNWALENSAHRYASFQSDFKSLKKRIRKEFAETQSIDSVRCEPYLFTYLRTMQNAYPRCGSRAEKGRFVLLWCQTRATGMADSEMIRRSLEKFEETVSQRDELVQLDPGVLFRVVRPILGCTGKGAKISVGTTSCLESTRKEGGKTAFVGHLARHRSLVGTYDLRTLEFTPCRPRPIRSAHELVSWAVGVILRHPTYSRCVRLHAVSEPSKARTITVAPYAYQVIMGVFAHLFQPCMNAKQIRSGLKADRHLWRFLTNVLNPQNTEWEHLVDHNVHALSTDLSEATDFGNKTVARQIWHAVITASECPGFPLGLAVLAKTLYCSKRYCFIPNGNGLFKLVTAHKGWFMGDMMTKVILTMAHQYCCEASGLRVYTLVGDDEIALDSDRSRLEGHLVTLGRLFKVSQLDTFISTNFVFYCEEGSILPQSAVETPHVQMRRGVELFYLDYPRLRLLLPQISEVDAYSMSNIGRFSLLGKESRWVHSSNPRASKAFSIASLLQHIIVPQEPDTQCPYTPIEIGGDGAWPHSDDFMHRAIEGKSFNPRETRFRLFSLLNGRFAAKFVRSDRLDKVVNKHHLYLPKIEGLRQLLPPESIIVPKDNNSRALLRSLRSDRVVDPQRVFFTLAKSCYYAALLDGKEPPEPVFNLKREYSGGHTSDPQVDIGLFRSTWSNPGFRFDNDWGYYVDMVNIPVADPLNLGWSWGSGRTLYPSAKETFALWMSTEVDIREAHIDDVLYGTIRDGLPLPERLVKRLNLILESDTYILGTLDRELVHEPVVALITRDQRLCRLVRSYLDRWKPGNRIIAAVDPVLYLTGRMEEVEDLLRPLDAARTWSLPVVEDPGAMLHVDYTEFTDGFPHDERIWDKRVTSYLTVQRITLLRLEE